MNEPDDKTRYSDTVHVRKHPATKVTRPYVGATDTPGSELWAATVQHLWPWRYRDYPGWMNCAAAALKLSPLTVKRWMFAKSDGVKVHAADKIIAMLRARATTTLSLLAAWEEYRRNLPPPHPRFGFREQALAEKSGWRSVPRKTPV